MPKMNCRCGAPLNDDDETTTSTYRTFTSAAWDQREEETDWRKQIPFSYYVWECRRCGRWYLFGLETDALEKVLVPEGDEG